MSDSSIMGQFAEAYRKGQVIELTSWLGPKSWAAAPLERNTDWALPSFDFGQIDDLLGSPDAWNKATFDDLWNQGLKLIREGKFHLPFDRCVYIFMNTNGTTNRQTYNIFVIGEEHGEVFGEVYFLNVVKGASQGQWTRLPWQFAIPNRGTINWAFHPDFEASAPPDVFNEKFEDLKAAWTRVICATVLLGSGGGTRQAAPSPATASMNAGRAKAKLEPLPDTIVVRLNRQSAPGLAHGVGAGKSPHERRRHFRTLRSGRVVPVRPSKIHGGSDQPRAYFVRP